MSQIICYLRHVGMRVGPNVRQAFIVVSCMNNEVIAIRYITFLCGDFIEDLCMKWTNPWVILSYTLWNPSFFFLMILSSHWYSLSPFVSDKQLNSTLRLIIGLCLAFVWYLSSLFRFPCAPCFHFKLSYSLKTRMIWAFGYTSLFNLHAPVNSF